MKGAAAGGCANTIPRASRSFSRRASPVGARRRRRRHGAVRAGADRRDHRRLRHLVHRGDAAVGPFRRPTVSLRLHHRGDPVVFRPPAVAVVDATLSATAPAAVGRASPVRAGARLVVAADWRIPARDGRMLRLHRAGHLAAGGAALRRLRPWRPAVFGLASDVGDARVRAEPVQYLQREPVLPRAAHADLLRSGLDARTPVRPARGDRIAPAGRLQHRVPVGRRLLRRRASITLPGR